jgi:hypothetical protein
LIVLSFLRGEGSKREEGEGREGKGRERRIFKFTATALILSS